MANYSAGFSYYSETFYDALVAARDAGVLFVASAGNDTSNTDVTPHYPSSYDLANLISVAATDRLDSLASFSNWGPTSVDLGAPGTDIRSTLPPFASVFYEDFDAVTPPDLGDQFTLEGSVNYWGTVDAGDGNITARGDAEHSYPYRPNSQGWIVTPPIDATDLRGLSMNFLHHCQMEEFYDALTAEVWDGADWQEIVHFTTYTDPDPIWWLAMVDLKPHRNPTWQLRFGWQTNETGNDYYGAEIDQVLIQHIGSDYTGEDAYGSMSGTSMAAPHVAGAAALLLAHNPDMCLTELRNTLIWTGDPLSTLEGATVSGRRLNVYKALTVSPDPAVLAPNGGEHWLWGSMRTIAWSTFACDLPDIDIYLLKGGVVHSLIADNAPNTGSFLWTVPEGLPIANDYRIRVDDGTFVDESDADFSLRPAGAVLYVDDDAPEGADGMSWDTAFKYLQDALSAAEPGDEIRVAAGTYRPDLDEWGKVTPGDPGTTFVPVGGVSVYGGYAGSANPADPDLRDLNLYESILSGDLAGDDGPVHVEGLAACWSGNGIPLRAACEAFDFDGDLDVDGDDLPAFLVANNYTENSYHVLTGSVDLGPAVVDGFTVVAGYASGVLPYPGDAGGGMYSPSYSSPIVTNCTFRGNAAFRRGGGMFNAYRSSPTVTDCRFIGNVARVRGGGMSTSDVSSLTVANCKFSENATYDGGGISLFTDNAMLYDCTFAGNTAGQGGGVYIAGDSMLVNCIFQGNLASGSYGGSLITFGNPVLTNCTFTGNEAATKGGALFNWFGGIPTLTNCILWGNEPNEIDSTTDSHPFVTYSNVQGGTGQPWFGPGCIDLNPWFIDADGPDNDLATEDDNVRLSADSPCIDAGDDSAVTVLTDPDGRARILDGDGDGTPVVDMGAYEFTPDCNDNGVSDDDDVAAGTSPDCNTNNVPDECEPGGANDCDVNGTTDWCDVEGGFAEDCNANWIPDDCDMADGSSKDCNINRMPDECDIADETSRDCNSSDVPDECEPGGLDDCNNDGTVDWCEIQAELIPDCNGNWIPDDCDLAGGTSENCNANEIPDECEPGGSTDCNDNETPDLCDIHTGACEDCNANWVPDDCDMADGSSEDCNINGIPDECDISDETSHDCNSSNVPDECEPGGLDDCDNDGTTDLCEIYAGSDTDCNENWIPDDCDLAGGTSEDCNANDVPDECEPGGSTDCNNNGTSDLCDIYTGASEDCNGNVAPDECDVSDGASLDENVNGIPDECECLPSSAAQPERLDLLGDPASQKVRYMSFAAGDEGRLQAIRITFVDSPPPYEHWIGTQLWVQQPVEYCENSGTAQGSPCPTAVGGLPSTTFFGANLDCDPAWLEWTPYGIVHVWNEGIVPGGVYHVQVVDAPCSTETEEDYSVPLILTQSNWADLVQDCTTTPCGPPEGSTGIVDVTAVLDKWKNLPGNVMKVRADIEGSPSGDHRVPDRAINITDVTYCLGAFLGDTYPPPGFPPPRDPPTCP